MYLLFFVNVRQVATRVRGRTTACTLVVRPALGVVHGRPLVAAIEAGWRREPGGGDRSVAAAAAPLVGQAEAVCLREDSHAARHLVLLVARLLPAAAEVEVLSHVACHAPQKRLAGLA